MWWTASKPNVKPLWFTNVNDGTYSIELQKRWSCSVHKTKVTYFNVCIGKCDVINGKLFRINIFNAYATSRVHLFFFAFIIILYTSLRRQWRKGLVIGHQKSAWSYTIQLQQVLLPYRCRLLTTLSYTEKE